MEIEESSEVQAILDQGFPWLCKIWGYWMAVNFFARRDFSDIHNGFPRLPFPLPTFAEWLHVLSRNGFVSIYRTAPFDDPQEDFVPSTIELEIELSRPQTGPSRDYGVLVATMSDLGSTAIRKRLDHYQVSSGRGFTDWTRNIFIPTILPAIRQDDHS